MKYRIYLLRNNVEEYICSRNTVQGVIEQINTFIRITENELKREDFVIYQQFSFDNHGEYENLLEENQKLIFENAELKDEIDELTIKINELLDKLDESRT